VAHDLDDKLISALMMGRALGAGGFAAIDFETATAARASACSAGVAVVRNGYVHEVRTWLIRPPHNEYDPFNIAIHGITPEMTAASPTLAEIWPEMSSFINQRPLVAHNAAFDMGVLRASLATGGTSCPDLHYACTYQLARRVWRGRLSYRLNDLAAEGGLYLDHHEAGSDAATAALLGVALCGVAGQHLIPDAVHAIGFQMRDLTEFGPTIRPSALRPDVDAIPADGPFVGKTVVFTGALVLSRTDAAQLVANAGGHVATTISRAVDYLVVGVHDPEKVNDGVRSSKMVKAAALADDGAPIEMLSEADFVRMLTA
jgi:DNA polymerase-3 subunit epsilon